MTAETADNWQPLSIAERRVLGVLVEKQKTTDTYPLTINSVVTGSNQKSNRDPILNFDDLQAEDALTSAQKKGLVMRIISGRVDKWKHLLYDAWKVSSPELAVITELLLRGPQTEGELRGRASRMDDIPDLDQLRAILKGLAERKLVVYLTPENRRGTMVTHGFHFAEELQHARVHAEGAAAVELPPAPAPSFDSQSALAELRQQMEELQQKVGRLQEVVAHLQRELGVSPPA